MIKNVQGALSIIFEIYIAHPLDCHATLAMTENPEGFSVDGTYGARHCELA